MSIIYLIECRRDYDTVYKIGYSKKSASRRLDSLQTGNDGELKIMCQKIENNLNALSQNEKLL